MNYWSMHLFFFSINITMWNLLILSKVFSMQILAKESWNFASFHRHREQRGLLKYIKRRYWSSSERGKSQRVRTDCRAFSHYCASYFPLFARSTKRKIPGSVSARKIWNLFSVQKLAYALVLLYRALIITGTQTHSHTKHYVD